MTNTQLRQLLPVYRPTPREVTAFDRRVDAARKMIAAGKSEREIAGRHGGVVAREARELAELEKAAHPWRQA